jgi:hypothetical protein
MTPINNLEVLKGSRNDCPVKIIFIELGLLVNLISAL